MNDSNAEFYLYQQSTDGSFQYTANCDTVFETVMLAEDGRLLVDDGAAFNGETLTATISANAVRGKYYLVVKLGDKYECIQIKLTANPNASTNENTNENTGTTESTTEGTTESTTTE